MSNDLILRLILILQVCIVAFRVTEHIRVAHMTQSIVRTTEKMQSRMEEDEEDD